MCVCVRACWGPLNHLHLLWGPAVFREVAFLHEPPDGSVTTALQDMELPPQRAALPKPRTEGLRLGQVGTIKESHN